MKLESNLQVECEDSFVQDLVVSPTSANSVELSWREVNANILKYDISCSNSESTHTIHQVKGAESAFFISLPPSVNYRCCVKAYRNERLSNVATCISSECMEVQLPQSAVSPTPTLTYFLVGLVGFLLVSVGFLAIGCFCVVLAKRKHQNTYPRYVVCYCNTNRENVLSFTFFLSL